MEELMQLENDGETCTAVIYHWLALSARGFLVRPEDLTSDSQEMIDRWENLSRFDHRPRQ